jgi:general secretion pathway protein D
MGDSPATPTAQRNTGSTTNRAASGGRFVVDSNRNAVVYRGSGQEWLNLLPTIRAMDRPAPAVLIEVLIAEVTLNDQETTGVEWLANGSITLDGSTYNANYGTLGGLGIGSTGFNLTLDNAGETRAVLNLFYENKRAEIRSRPRLMVMSGQSARIDVGDEIPVVSSSSRSIDNPDAPIVNNVEYRRTGVKLEIKPTVHASGFVDVEVNQELSQAQKTTTSDIDSPTIFNRSIQTTVSLKDGGSILLGGLVSSVGGNTARGVPILGKLPLVGKLFRTDAETEDRTELMVLVIPYVVRSPDEAAELTRTLGQPL